MGAFDRRHGLAVGRVALVGRVAHAAILAAPLLAGCIQGQGATVTETRDVRSFDRIEAGAGIQVVVTIGPAGPLTVSAQENIIPAIATTVSGDTLVVDAKDDFASLEPVTVTVTVPALDAASLDGGAVIAVAGLTAETFTLHARGGARATVTGQAGTVTLDVDGGASADLGGLSAETVQIRTDAGSTATVRASDRVAGTADGGASVIVLGGASIEVQADGGAAVTRGGAS
jgi:hypothetical protein